MTPETSMHVRAPNFQPDQGNLIWSQLPEFALAYNGYSTIIPHVEYYLNSIMNEVRGKHCANNPKLKQEIDTFIKQEVNHSRYHVRFNKRMHDAGYTGLQALVDQMSADLKRFRETKSLAFNVAYCVGFESIATHDAVYLYEECDAYLEGAEPEGANLLLWHVAEEFEHRSVCHDAFKQVSNNYFLRVGATAFAFWHIGGAFMRAEQIVLNHHLQGKSPAEVSASKKVSSKLFWRQIRYMLPRMLPIFLPWYDPAKLRVPPRIQAALGRFLQPEPLNTRIDLNDATPV